MASLLKDTISKVTTGQSSTESNSEDKKKYKLKVTAGTTYDTSTKHAIVVNGKDCVINNKCKVAVRIREYQGLPGQSEPESPYFQEAAHTKDTYSIAFSWSPEENVSAEDLVWGIEMVNPIGDRIPKRFITTSFDICKTFVDSSLICDPYADKPWVNGAILCGSAMTWSIGAKSQRVPPPDKVLSEGATGDGASVRHDYGIPDDEVKRRKFFSDQEKRTIFAFEKGRCYQFDFHNGYIDWKDYALKLPGFSLSVLKWINDRTHTVRFVMKNRKTGQQYLVVTFRLLFGDQLKGALASGEVSTENQQSSRESSRSDEVRGADAESIGTDEAQEAGGARTESRDVKTTKENNASETHNESRTVGSAEERDAAEAQLADGASSSHDDQSGPTSDLRLNGDEHSSRAESFSAPVHAEYVPENSGKPGTVQPHEKFDTDISHSKEESSNMEQDDIQGGKTTGIDQGVSSKQSGQGVESGDSGAGSNSNTANDAGLEKGYRNSIEESLCQTMSVDARGKETSVLR